MLNRVILPKLGTNIDEGVILQWRKNEGERVAKGEVLLIVETTKAVFEVEAETDGYLRKIFSKEGEAALFTEPVALLSDKADEDISGHIEQVKQKEVKKRHHEEKRKGLARPAETAVRERFAATPAAKRLSAEMNIDLASIASSMNIDVIDEKAVREFSGKKKIAIYGAGLGAKQAKELLRFSSDFVALGLFDDNPEMMGMEVAGLKVLGGWEDFLRLSSEGGLDGVAISLHSEHRRKLLVKIKKSAPGVELVPLVDKRVMLGEGVVISGGAFIEAGSVIGPDTFVGEGAIVDTGAVVSHDCFIGPHSHLSPGCCLSGVVKLEENVLVGVGACVNSQVSIGKNSVITPGSAVVFDVPDDVVVSGNPARIIGKSYRGA